MPLVNTKVLAERLSQVIAAQRCRDLMLHPLSSGLRTVDGVVSRGLSVAGDDIDFVFYQSRTIKTHREHIIVHDLAHTLFGHLVPTLSTPMQQDKLTEQRMNRAARVVVCSRSRYV
jgi:hypothetical protein